MKTEEYLELLTEQIRCKKARGAVEQEIRSHVEEQKADFLSMGMEAAEAEETAVREMGDPIETGNQMNRIHRPRMAWGSLSLIVLLSVVGFFVQYEVDNYMRADGIVVGSIVPQILAMVIGFVVMLVVCFVDYSWIGKHAKPCMVLLWVGIIAGSILFGASMNGTRAWIVIGSFSFDIRRIILLAVPLFAAILYGYRGQGYRAIAKSTVWMLPSLLIVFSCSSMLTAMTLLFVFAMTLSVAVYKKWFCLSRKRILLGIWAVVAFIPLLLGMAVYRFGAAYAQARIAALINPTGYEGNVHMRLLHEFLAGCKMIGASQGTVTMDQLPLASGNYALTYIFSCYGILAAALFMGLMLLLFLRFLNTACRQKNRLGMIMGVGCGTVFSMQIVLYVLCSVGIVQLGGYYCPFIVGDSAGIIVTYAMLGILLSIYRYQTICVLTFPPGQGVT